MRLLTLPEDILIALEQGRISEGHTRPLLMLASRPAEQITLFKEMLMRKMTVREAEGIARRIAYDKVRKKDRFFDPDIADMEGRLAESLGTRVHIEKKEVGGKILIDFFSYEELQNILTMLEHERLERSSVLTTIQNSPIAVFVPIVKEVNVEDTQNVIEDTINQDDLQVRNDLNSGDTLSTNNDSGGDISEYTSSISEAPLELSDENISEEKMSDILDDRSKSEVRNDEQEEDLYNLKNFSL
jgi:hypothetical protein